MSELMSVISVASETSFQSLGLQERVQAAVDSKGYTVPTPIQAQTIPFLLEGRDVLGQASTGTGKTAAFALPLLSRLDLSSRATQVLVLAPTRELAMQVAVSFSTYGENLPGLNIQPIYGGASYYNQIRELKRGVHVVVGTPGRVMDHMRRGTLTLDNLKCLVLDEADEMLRMGFVDDVKWILEQTPAERQIALFSATMPEPIRRIASEHLRNPATVTIRSETSISATIRPRYLLTSHREKTGALIRILETENTDGVIVFTKTKETTLRVADELIEHGFSAVAINGDIVQKQREHTIEQLRNGKLDILVATDVAARGLDVQRISHVINYDLPHDSEAWIHRIGRTGRAGRQGEAILFLTPHERRYLRGLERDTRQPIAEMQFPTAAAVNARRKADLRKQVADAMTSPKMQVFKSVLAEIQQESGASAEDVAAAVAVIMFGDRPFLLEEHRRPERARREDPRDARGRDRHERRPDGRHDSRSNHRISPVGPAEAEPLVFEHRPVRHSSPEQAVKASGNESTPSDFSSRDAGSPGAARKRPADGFPADSFEQRPPKPRRGNSGSEAGMETYRVEVGHEHGVKPGNIVGAIANEAGLDSKNIGRIDIREDHSFVDLPEGMPMEIFRGLKDVIVLGRHLRITRTQDARETSRRAAHADARTPAVRPGSRSSRPRSNDRSQSAGNAGPRRGPGGKNKSNAAKPKRAFKH